MMRCVLRPLDAVALAGALLAGCGGVQSDSVPAACEARPGSETDLSAEPDYAADYLYRWHDEDGCPVRLDVLMLREPGPDFHCAPWPPEVVIGSPLGASQAASSARIYVGSDDPAWWDPSVEAGYAEDAALPVGAVDTGYRREGTALWTDPGDESAVYLVSDEGVERWPLSAGMGCG
jgi:hypothetical protein